MIKRLIFDVDGTLITGVNFTSAVEKTLKKFDLYNEDNVQKFLKGIYSYEDKFNNYNKENYIGHFSEILNKQLTMNFLNTHFENLKSLIPKDSQKLINTIKTLSKKYELVLLTNYFSESQLNRLNEMGIGHYFTECHGEKIMKPNYDAYIMACGNNKPSECVMIGDDIYLDIEKAQEAGLNTIWVNSKNALNETTKKNTVQSVCEISEELIEKL